MRGCRFADRSFFLPLSHRDSAFASISLPPPSVPLPVIGICDNCAKDFADGVDVEADMTRKMYKGSSARSNISDRSSMSAAVAGEAGAGLDTTQGEGGSSGLAVIKEEIARALYEFKAADGEEMSLKIGDVVTVVDKDGDWWQGKLHGDAEHTIGWFPAQ